VHVGGGEPFLHLEGFKRVLQLARQTGVSIDYVETNSSCYKNKESAVATLREMKEAGLGTLLVSISPFHNEHIPFYKVKGIIEACKTTGISIFPWIREFIDEIASFDDRVTHSISEYEKAFGGNYLKKIPNRYWIHFGGRALHTYQDILTSKDLQTLFSSNSGGCREIEEVGHFHLDLFGNYIPGLCSGLAISREDLGAPISQERYPLLSLLHRDGIKGLYQMATAEYGFGPAERYLSKCHLCFDIRRHLVLDKGIEQRELQPKGFYANV